MRITRFAIPGLVPLPSRAEIAPNVWVCPGQQVTSVVNTDPPEPQAIRLKVCEGGEHYIEISQGPLRQYFDSCVRETAREFRVPMPQQTRLVIGRSPLTQVVGGQCFVILQQNSNIHQLLRQSGHESYHRACGPEKRGWVQEMLAENWTMKLLRQSGNLSYYESCEQVALKRCTKVNPRHLPGWDGGAPLEFYDLVYVCGQRLIELCGWERFRGLLDTHTTPDYRRWVHGLPSGMRSVALRIVGL